jgi:prepilin-type N-terminal cleavage/methylation domain-containing protein
VQHSAFKNSGFTLIELSIVLVIIGLIIGGIVAGQEMIGAAAVRAQISQIEKYNSAVNTFYVKYGYLPGDVPDPYASQFGFAARGAFPGEGDGNGRLDGIDSNNMGAIDCDAPFAGEQAMFWVDLSVAKLIEGGFNTATPVAIPGLISGSSVSLYFPAATIGRGNYITVFSGGWLCVAGSGNENSGPPYDDGLNYFSVAVIGSNQNPYLWNENPWGAASGNGDAGMTVAESYSIDNKIDDGLPQSGRVMAYDVTWEFWASGNQTANCCNADPSGGPVVAGDGVATPPTSITCFDNGSVGGATEKYSVGYQNGINVNCALIFKMEGAGR